MKKKHYWLIAAVACLTYVTSVVAINFIVDPYGEFGFSKTRKFSCSGFSYPYQAFKLLEQNDYILVFGTSHSATLSKDLFGKNVINLSTSIYGFPQDVYAFVSQLNPNQVRHVKRIYCLCDYFIDDRPPRYVGVAFSSVWEFYLQTLRDIGPEKIIAVIDNTLKNSSGQYTRYITATGESVYLKENSYTNVAFPKKDHFKFAATQEKYYRFVEEFCKAKNIECVFFKTILSKYFLQNMEFCSIEKHFQELLSQVDGVYSLMYVQGVSDSLSNFHDPTHHSYRVSRIEADILTSPEKRKPFWVTSENLAEYLAALKKAID